MHPVNLQYYLLFRFTKPLIICILSKKSKVPAARAKVSVAVAVKKQRTRPLSKKAAHAVATKTNSIAAVAAIRPTRNLQKGAVEEIRQPFLMVDG